MNAAILFEPDGYLLTGPKLMGRQAAGDGFLRAVVKGRGGEPLYCYTPSRSSALAFRNRLQELDPTVSAGWIPANRLSALAARGVLYRPDHSIGMNAYTRLRVGADRYSLCGVTHTLATAGSMELISSLATAPVMPWDAVICTSSVSVTLLQEGLAAQADYLRWRFGIASAPPPPQLPLIPLGTHTEDFAFGPNDRAAARAAIGLAEDEVAGLFAGRLTFSGKAHPYPMYRALQTVAEATGRKVTLIHSGQFANPAIGVAFHAAVAQYCPDVRCLFLDGKDAQLYRQAWQAADLFISLSDNFQETFGLTPVEAMASGLPVLVTDWNGYKDTVRDGIDGFRIPTWQPEPGLGENVSRDYETGMFDYDYFLSRTSTLVAADMRLLIEKLTLLVTDGELRRRMGAAGQARARELYDWGVVYKQYQGLWTELNAIRAAAGGASLLAAAPAVAPHWRDTFTTFSHYPSQWAGPDTRIRGTAEATVERYQALTAKGMLAVWTMPVEVAERVFAALAAGPTDLKTLAKDSRTELREMVHIATRLAKMGLVELS